MITFYYNNAPNPMKVALFLEEAGLPYKPVPVDTRRGEQHKAEYLKLNPNAKVPTLVDGEAVVFDSNAILLYLGRKTNKFMPPKADDPRVYGEMLSWMMFVASGIGPYCGQAVHFRVYAPEPKAYALNRYDFEAERHWKIVEQRLARQPYMLGEVYTIVDMALWGWARLVPMVMGGEEHWAKFPSVKRLVDEINGRPANEKVEALRRLHTFKTDLDEEAKRNLFQHLARSSA